MLSGEIALKNNHYYYIIIYRRKPNGTPVLQYLCLQQCFVMFHLFPFWSIDLTYVKFVLQSVFCKLAFIQVT